MSNSDGSNDGKFCFEHYYLNSAVAFLYAYAFYSIIS